MRENLSFADAIKHAMEGARIKRSGWNGKDQFVCFMPPMTIPADKVNERTRKFLPTGDLVVGGYFVIHSQQKVWQPGWSASQGDLTAHDWIVLGEAES